VSNVLAINVADAIVAEINGAVWPSQPEAFTAARKYFVLYKDGDVQTMQVDVIPVVEMDGILTRKPLRQTDVEVWLDLQRKIDAFAANPAAPDVNSEVDAYVNFAASMKAFFSDRHRIPGLTSAWYEGAAFFNGQLWDPARLYHDKVYEAAIKLTVRSDY
jgi:hypothetical protein